jgi:hypothetical protein
MNSWEDELRVYFPGYLLPSASIEALSREAASRFLDRLTGTNDSLRLLLAASAIAPVAAEVHDFAKELELFARVLPSRTAVERVESDSQIRGRLDVPGTLRRNLAGKPSGVVSSVPKRHFDLPENVLLVATARRLTEFLAKLEERGAIAKDAKRGWSAGFRSCSEKIKHTLGATVLRDVPNARIEAFHEQAARVGAHRAYRLALRLHEAMKGIETKDEATLARVVADGALSPLDTATRFELAVLIRLGRSIENALSGRRYTVDRALIEKDRSHIFEFLSGQDRLRIHYNHVLFSELGARDRGIRHYFGEQGRFRPDITLEILRNEQRVRALIVEVKHSEDTEYLKDGYQKALLYRAEYEKELLGWPKAILVVSSDSAIQGAPRREDEVIAVDWKRWVPEIVLTELLGGFGISASQHDG